MQETISKYKEKIVDKWNSVDKGVRIKAICVLIALIAALALTIYLAVRPKWVVIEGNADIQTIGVIQNAFNDAGISNKITRNGTSISVEEKNVNQAKLLIAEKNITKSGFTFDDALDANGNGIGLSESDKSQLYSRAYETEIAELIKTIDGVDSAKVRLVFPDDTVFFEKENNEASAGITIFGSKEITKEQALTIARLVSMSVKGLSMNNIEIVDQNANSLYSGSSNDTSSYSSKEDIENQKKKEIELKIRAALANLYDDVNIISNLKIDWNQRQQKTVTYTPPVNDMTIGVPKIRTREDEEVLNGTEGNAPGTDTNDVAAPNYATGDENGSSYTGTKETNEYIYNQDEVVVDYKGGEVVPDQSSISIVVYNNREYDEALLRETGALDNITWDEFKTQNSAVQNLEIDQALLNSIIVGTGIENVSIVGYEKPVFIDEVVEPLKIEQIVILAILALLLVLLAFGLIKKTHPDEVEEIEPELSVEDLLVSTKIEDEKEAERIADIDTNVESEYKKQIEKFISEKPDAVAQLLRNWLSDDWE